MQTQHHMAANPQTKTTDVGCECACRLPLIIQNIVAAVVKGRKSVYRKQRKTWKTCFI